MRISDWSSDVCSSDLARFLAGPGGAGDVQMRPLHLAGETMQEHRADGRAGFARATRGDVGDVGELALDVVIPVRPHRQFPGTITALRSEEHTSELQSLMRISYAVFCLKKKKKKQ